MRSNTVHRAQTHIVNIEQVQSYQKCVAVWIGIL